MGRYGEIWGETRRPLVLQAVRFVADIEISLPMQAVRFVAERGHALLPQYTFDAASGACRPEPLEPSPPPSVLAPLPAARPSVGPTLRS